MSTKRVIAHARARFVQFCLGLAALVPAHADATPSMRTTAQATEAAPPSDEDVVIPDLGIIRYRDPSRPRSIWLGLDVTGAYVPEAVGVFNRTVWMVRTVPTWSVALTRWLALGGRNGLAWYDAQNIRLRVHMHQLELSGQPMFRRPHMRDRLAIGVEVHDLNKSTVDGIDFRLGGIRDTIGTLGYGIEHLLTHRWRLAWQLQLRHAWIFIDTQRQIRLSVRASFLPKPQHLLSLELVGFAVNRVEDQAGTDVPENSVYGQAAFDYTWMSRKNVGLNVRTRILSSFMSGEAPIYEIREEALDGPYAELLVGLRAVWD